MTVSLYHGKYHGKTGEAEPEAHPPDNTNGSTTRQGSGQGNVGNAPSLPYRKKERSWVWAQDILVPHSLAPSAYVGQTLVGVVPRHFGASLIRRERCSLNTPVFQSILKKNEGRNRVGVLLPLLFLGLTGAAGT